MNTHHELPPVKNEPYLRSVYEKSQDILFLTVEYPVSSSESTRLLLYYCQGLTDTDKLNQTVLPRLAEAAPDIASEAPHVLSGITGLNLQPVDGKDWFRQANDLLFRGHLLILTESDRLYSCNLAAPLSRTPEEPKTETSLLGPRDGFIEQLDTNVALIRKRLLSHHLSYKEFRVGLKSRTRVGLMYMDGTADPRTIREVEERISRLEMDGLFSISELIERIVDSKFALFPAAYHSGRPDFAVRALLKGRLVILFDGSPTVAIAPITVTFAFKSAEDAHTHFYFVAFGRLLRMFGLFLAVFLPGFWIALLTFHQDQFPVSMLATIVISRQGVPFPSQLELFAMLILFELFREAGMRLPPNIGQTLSVVGGLIIGQAAISAGLASPSMVVVMATSMVASFVTTTQTLFGTISILRIFVLILSASFGLYGFLLSAFAIITYVVNLTSFGVPLMSPLSPTSMKEIVPELFRTPFNRLTKRLRFLKKISPKREE
ncbi:spore germination protein GerKA [Paenibacillus elgii]|uniref:spore germination protein n=1 Tax=Paenibacillus elgii TaxID=189691 RepID=UPI002D7A8F6B|nr:spore germination protein GerKA [Paenibacillus elgii]